MSIVGIDPGLNGAWAVVRDGELLGAGDMPTIDKAVAPLLLYNELTKFNPSLVVIEQVHAMPKNGSISGFKLGHAAGVALGACMFWPVTLAAPAKWKGDMGVRKRPGMKPNEAKELSRAEAVRLFPEMSHLFSRKKDADRAEAALIALWGERQR